MFVQRSNSALNPARPERELLRARARALGFTLVELMVVVIIIGVSAALATPAVFSQMRQRRLREGAQQLAALYSGARMRALSRGAAVKVNYLGNGQFEVLESVDGATLAAARNSPACGDEPGLGCLSNNWKTGQDTRRQVTTLALQSELAVTLKDPAGNVTPTMSVCFTPMGRSFVAPDNDSLLQPLAGAPIFTLERTGNWGGGYGYYVALLPNGIARVADVTHEAAP
ncbi:MAG TPA: prepilin-type N-terminal cleavage/methylation domain-containing protein [Polyangiaceae bacterium]|nr:prepilin-type N-terminal cleavage/methylation domain-containing protein [Polyangiaceae bacterium]